MALKIYQLCGASGKVIVALAEKGDMGALQAYTGQSGGQLNYLQVRCQWLSFRAAALPLQFGAAATPGCTSDTCRHVSPSSTSGAV
jgi:hypothetical protein